MLFIADNLLQRTNFLGPAGVRYREVSLYAVAVFAKPAFFSEPFSYIFPILPYKNVFAIRRGKINYMVLVPARTPFDCRTTFFFFFHLPYFSAGKWIYLIRMRPIICSTHSSGFHMLYKLCLYLSHADISTNHCIRRFHGLIVSLKYYYFIKNLLLFIFHFIHDFYFPYNDQTCKRRGWGGIDVVEPLFRENLYPIFR